MRRRMTSSRAESTFLTDTGVPIKGYVTGVRKDEDISFPVRYFVTGPYSPIKVGQKVATIQGEKFLLGAHTYRGREISYRAIPVVDNLSWTRVVEVIDPVTRMTKDTTAADLGVIETTLETMSSERDGLRIPNARFAFYTGEAVKEGDTVNGMAVASVTKTIGLNLVVLT